MSLCGIQSTISYSDRRCVEIYREKNEKKLTFFKHQYSNINIHSFKSFNPVVFSKKKLSFATNSYFLIPISLQPSVIDLRSVRSNNFSLKYHKVAKI